MFYLFLAVLLFVGALSYSYNQLPLSKTVKVVLFFCFWLVAGLAWETGVDWKAYAGFFDSALPLDRVLATGSFSADSFVSSEPLYMLLSSVVKTFTNEYQFLQASTLFIASIYFFKGLSKYSPNYYVILLLYLGYVYLTLNMSGIRQAVSLSIVFYALQFVESRQLWKFVRLVLLATLFHYSSLIILPLYWLLHRKISARRMYLLIGIGMLVYIGRISVISGTIEQVSQSMGNHVLYRLWLYVTGAQEALPSISAKMFLNVILFVMLVLRRDKLTEISKYANIFINLFFIYILMGQYMWDTGDIVIRLQHYFILGLIVGMAIYLDGLVYRGNRIIATCFIFILAIWSSNPIFLESPTRISYNPYQNYFWYKLTDSPSTGTDRLQQLTNDNRE